MVAAFDNHKGDSTEEHTDQNNSFFNRVKNLFRRNTSIQNNNTILKPGQIEMIKGKEFETLGDMEIMGRKAGKSNHAEIYSPIMNESQPMKEGRSFHEESKSHHYHQSSTSNVQSISSKTYLEESKPVKNIPLIDPYLNAKRQYTCTCARSED